MGVYQNLTTGVNLSQMITQIELRNEAMRSHERGTTTPPNPVAGGLWVRTDYPTIGESIVYRTAGGVFTLLMDPDFAQINAGGTVPFAANQGMGGFKLTGLAAGTGNGDSVRFEQPLMRAGGQMTLNTGVIDMNNSPITGLPGPTDGLHAARKFYVDAQVADAKPEAGAAAWDPSAGALAVTLGFQPKAVLLIIEQVNPSFNVPGSASVQSTPGLFVAGTGSESQRVIHGGLIAPFNTPTFENLTVGYTGTGFTLQVATTSWRYVRARFLAWKS